jgi:hypothetical protein
MPVQASVHLRVQMTGRASGPGAGRPRRGRAWRGAGGRGAARAGVARSGEPGHTVPAARSRAIAWSS